MPGLIPITSLPLLPQSALSSLGATYTTSSSSSRTTSPTISMQLPQTANFATILAPGGTVPSGTALQLGNLQPTTLGQNSISQQTSSSTQPQTVYRIPQGSVASIAGVRTSNSQASSSGASQPTAVTMVPNTQQELSVMPGTVMYHAQHGVVYATSASGSLPEIILNLGQSSQTAFTVPQNQASGQQFITIPVPVTLTAAQQQQQLFQSFSQNGSSSTVKTTSGANRLHSPQYLTTVKREKDGK
ncbi:uncharacterized protein LOC106469799 isoform X1 [Limulus polyphemus]|uniref:Uncharacterized protein LOC106469799 isoform X1 n=1 Tax=Limulus polyphemus TaxID=6850 RepID=A0ABM1TDW3_LIMPO|nr:uncharacterized protein LOC106469799 isoform X1 [Limulus polyphemus]